MCAAPSAAGACSAWVRLRLRLMCVGVDEDEGVGVGLALSLAPAARLLRRTHRDWAHTRTGVGAWVLFSGPWLDVLCAAWADGCLAGRAGVRDASVRSCSVDGWMGWWAGDHQRRRRHY